MTQHGLSLRRRLWLHVHRWRSPEWCWLWEGAHDKDGYGQIKVDSKMVRAHRASWEVAYGPIPDGLVICHSCDHPSCIRPSHLFLGTQSDNIRDSVSKGRHNSVRRAA